MFIIISAVEDKICQCILEILHTFMIHVILKMVFQVKKLDMYEILFCGNFLCKNSNYPIFVFVESLFSIKKSLELFNFSVIYQKALFEILSQAALITLFLNVVIKHLYFTLINYNCFKDTAKPLTEMKY